MERFAPTPSVTSLRLLLAVMTFHDMDLSHADVKQVLINAEVEEESTLSFLLGWLFSQVQRGSPSDLSYGIVQTARNWHQLLTEELEKRGYQQSEADPCPVPRILECRLAVHVDDLLLARKISLQGRKIIKSLNERFEVNDLEEGSGQWGAAFTVTGSYRSSQWIRSPTSWG
ncbi:unnamed protein product [Discosporangium mesarthrocarpum]